MAIHNWVRNTIEYTPSAGAIQSAQDTLDKKRGNATDTASLLIALLRASSIPARYPFDTIDIPAAAAQNWLGGTTHPEAALQLINQGGIAAKGLATGGQLTTIRMEHVGRAIANGRDEGVTKLLFDDSPEAHGHGKILGGGMVGTHAGDMISEVALAIEMGADAIDIGKTIHPHPTLGESIGMAAEVAHGSCTDLPPARK